MTTAQEFIRIDITQSGRLLRQYYKSSSLPWPERRKYRPEVCQYRRDKVLHQIMRREMAKVLESISKMQFSSLAGQPARKGGE